MTWEMVMQKKCFFLNQNEENNKDSVQCALAEISFRSEYPNIFKLLKNQSF